MFRLITLSALSLFAIACSHSHKADTAAVAPETKALAKAEQASYVAEVKFDKGSAALSESTRNELDRVIASAAAAGKIEKIQVITWADGEYPADVQKALPKPQRDLAAKRNSALNDYIKKKTSGVNVDTFNMAERPNALENLFNTSDARIKRSLESAGISNTATALRSSANASKSVVMLVLDEP